MKKLMIAAAIVCAAAFAQAATINWQVPNGIQVTGDFDNPDGSETFAEQGWAIYLFDANKVGGVSDVLMQSMIEAATTTDGYATFMANFTGDNTTFADKGVINSDGGVDQRSGIDMTLSEGNTYDGYLVLFNNADITAADQALFIATASVDKGDTTPTLASWGEDFDGDFYINGTTGWAEVGAAPIPEPTSGLLLLLGVAGMALRRRRA